METFEEQNLVQQAEHFLAQPPVIKKANIFSRLWLKFRWLFILLLIGLVMWLAYVTLFEKVNWLSPLAVGQVLSISQKKLSAKEMIGFLPYWSINRGAKPPVEILDEVIFFGFSVDEQGNIGQSQQDQLSWRALKTDSFQQLQSTAVASQTRLGVAFTCFNDATINQFLNNQPAIDNFITQAGEIAEEYGFTSFNLDFEFVQLNQPQNTPEKFNQFVRQVKNAFPENKISFDVYANAIIHQRPYDLKTLGQLADQMIIMAYDFHRPSSDNTGPVAPINQPYASAPSIIEALKASFDLVAPEKTILGIPLYGYEWQTATDQAYAATVPQSGALASLSRTRQLIQDKNLSVQWDNRALSPWLTYQDDLGKTKQIYFENLYSLSLKYQLVKQANLAGVAYWALGYEGDFIDVWQEAGEKLKES